MSEEKKFKVTLTEEELRALIAYHSREHSFASDKNCIDAFNVSIDRSARIHDLTKRLNAKEKEADNNEADQQQNEAQAAATNEPVAAKTGW